jgi:hypothetical protein
MEGPRERLSQRNLSPNLTPIYIRISSTPLNTPILEKYKVAQTNSKNYSRASRPLTTLKNKPFKRLPSI